MKKLIALLLVLAMALGMTACSQVSANDLMKDVPSKAVDVLPDMDAGAAAAADFGVRLFKTSMEEGKNTLISLVRTLRAGDDRQRCRRRNPGSDGAGPGDGC